MIRPRCPVGALAVLVALSFTTAGKVEIITWTYDWSPKPRLVRSDGDGTGGIAFTDEPRITTANSKETMAAHLWIFSSALERHPDEFTATPYKLNVQITDAASHKSGMLTFTGTLNGRAFGPAFLTNGRLLPGHAQISNEFTGSTSQSLHLGTHLYTIAMEKFLTPRITPTGFVGGDIQAYVRVRHNPEPSTLLLTASGLGAGSIAALWRWRRRRPETGNQESAA
jgi:hypothetical protein